MNYYNHLKALHYFLVTARYLSIKRAAESLFVTQAAISQQIRLLEDALGVALFHRQHRALVLTQEGARLLPHLEVAFEAIEKGVDGLVSDNDPNTITLSVLPSFASRWLIPRLVSFYEANPTISINLSMTDKLEVFGYNGVDLAIRFGLGEYEGVKSQFLMKDYIYPACHPVYLKEQNIKTVKDLKKQRLLEDTTGDIAWDHWLEKKGITKKQLGAQGESRNRVRYDGSHYVIDSALSAQGVAMVRHSLVAEAIDQSQLVKLFDEAVELDSKYFICAPEHYFQYSKVKSFSNWLKQEVDDFCVRYKL
ncbi:MAG: LysR family glycine cleavage system transcriptional activator [Cellvibrionaceae bacterium]